MLFDYRLPVEDGAGDIRAAACGIVLGKRLVNKRGLGARNGKHFLRTLQHSELGWVPILTGACSSDAARRIMPSMRSKQEQKLRVCRPSPYTVSDSSRSAAS